MTIKKKSRLEAIREVRLAKAEKLRELGIDPYPAKSIKEYSNNEIVENYSKYEGKKVTLTGRLMSWREHGNIAFGHIQDESGQIQIFIQKKLLSETSKENQTLGFKDAMKLLDVGDFVQATGEVGKTVRGEVSLLPIKIMILTKSIRPLPEKWHGLKDVEERYRKRYLDTIMNRDVKTRLDIRSKVITAMRGFLDMQGYVEVETPTLQPVYGGGFAKPFSTHHNALDSDFYLRISDEMYLKRLIVGGYEKIYEITKVFRNEGVDHDHNPEFTMFEAMTAFEDYGFGMDIIEEIIEHCAEKVLGTTELEYQGKKLSVKRPWKRLRVVEAIEEFTGMDPLKWELLKEAKESVMGMDIRKEKLSELKKMNTIGEVIAFAFEETVEEKLIQPTIIYDYPVEISPLAKKCDDPRFTQRFEMFAFGSELGNNYTELTDPSDLHKRFVEEKKREKAGFDEAHQTDYDYLTAIEHGFPPTCGIAIGIDRLVMMFTDSWAIREIIAFPTLKPLQPIKRSAKKVQIKGEVGMLSSSFVSEYQSASVGYAVIQGMKVEKKNNELEKEKKETALKYEDLSIEKIGGYSEIKSYRQMYEEMGVDLRSRRPSPEALLRRIAQGKLLYDINTCVDAYNVVVLRNRVSLGAFDVDNMKLPFSLEIAEGGEEIDLLGVDGVTKINKGEVFYADQIGPYNLDFNFRDAERTKITENTKNILINVDGVYEVTENDVKESLDEAIEMITKYCGGKVVKQGVISAKK